LDEASSRLAASYLSLGLKTGDRVASLMPNRTALTTHYIACIKAGLVATPLNYRYRPPEIDHALEVSGASILIAHVERADDVAESRLANQLPLGTLFYGSAETGKQRWEDLLQSDRPSVELPVVDDSAPVIIFFTSGSTGKPKGVTHTYGTLGWMLASLVPAIEISPSDVVLPASSHSHIGGMMLSLGALSAGATIVIPRTCDGDELLPLLRDHRPTLLCMLPAALFGLVRDHNASRDDFRSLRLCMAGGDKVSAELEREFTDLTGLAIDEVYGMTEISYTTLNPPSGTNKVGSIGKACPGFCLAIRDDEGNDLPSDTPGRLWVKSPTNMIGYWQNAAATNETILDGWLDTGDLMIADADGYLSFHGRKKQIIVHDGSNICPQEVEEALLEHPAVLSAGVIGIHNLVHGENVLAYISLRPGAARPSDQELIQFARARIGYKAPEEIVVLEEMPLNATGKVDRVALKEMSSAGS
jgi:long-chain acyl-CoA synthetase